MHTAVTAACKIATLVLFFQHSVAARNVVAALFFLSLSAAVHFIFGNQSVTTQHSVAAGNALAMLVAYVTTSVALCLLPM